MLVIVKVALPVLLRVKLSGELLVSVGWLTKVKLVGERPAIGVAPVPVKANRLRASEGAVCDTDRGGAAPGPPE